MKRRILIVLSIALLPALALGQDDTRYQCSHGELQRRVEILYETGGTLPCEVHYHKDTEAPGESQVLWRAMNQAGYCEQKTEAFIVKLRGLGWTCGTGVAAPAPPTPPVEPTEPTEPTEPVEPSAPLDPVDPAEIDDTEALAPADEEADAD
jgi:hypothetical protein